MTPPDRLSLEEIQSWPKAELHCHLDGSLRLPTVLDLAIQQGKLSLLPSTSLDELAIILAGIDKSDSLESYLAWFRYTIPLMQTKEALHRVAFELAEDNALENVKYLEVRYGPILHTEDGLSMEQVNDAVRSGLLAAEEKYDITTSIIVCGLRDRFESASLMQAELAVRQRENSVVAFDLAGGESGHPAKQHLTAFYYARNNLLNLTIHAGESWGPDSIRQAIFYCGAHRIGHGITLVQDEALLKYFVDHQIPLEICPTSNVQTHAVASFEEHPIRYLVERGVPVTVNTDNRLFSRTTVSEELFRVHVRCGVNSTDLVQIVRNGFRYSFLPWHRKQELCDRVNELLPKYN